MIVFIEFVSFVFTQDKNIFFERIDLDSEEIYQSFFRTHTCYDCMPKSGKVVLLDSHLTIRKAFFALVFNSVRTALVWNSETLTNIGLITISDFIHMLVAAYDSQWNSLDTLEKSSIIQWKEQKKKHEILITLSPADRYKTHRMIFSF